MSYVVNTQYTLTFTFTDKTGALADPTTVVVTLLDPTGTTSTPAATKTGTGVYTAPWTPTIAGNWKATAKGTGALVVHSSDTALWVDGSFAP